MYRINSLANYATNIDYRVQNREGFRNICTLRYYTSNEVIYLSHCNNNHDIGILGRTYLQNL